MLTRAACDAGVRVVCSPHGARLIGDSRTPAVATSSGNAIPADVVVTAIGDVPNIEWLAGSGPLLDGGVRVDERCRARSGVVAAGDCAAPVGKLKRLLAAPGVTASAG